MNIGAVVCEVEGRQYVRVIGAINIEMTPLEAEKLAEELRKCAHSARTKNMWRIKGERK